VITIVVALWLACSFVAWGLALGAFTKEFPTRKHYNLLPLCIVGPLSLAALIIFRAINRMSGWRIVPLTKEQRWEEFLKQGYGILGREYFEEHYG